jgi:hypothetical protein
MVLHYLLLLVLMVALPPILAKWKIKGLSLRLSTMNVRLNNGFYMVYRSKPFWQQEQALKLDKWL